MAVIQHSGTRHVEVCYSKDDGGWYVQQNETYRGKHRFRTSKEVYKTHTEAEKAYIYGDVKWTKWS